MKLTARFLNSRRAMRVPLPIFRAGFGWIFGSRLLMLEHTGRSSGMRREAVLEVVERESRDTVLIASGLGPNSQWYRNLSAYPICRVSIGFVRRRDASAELLSADDSRAALGRDAAKHPATFRWLIRTITEATGDAEPEIPIVRLRLRSPRR